MNLLIFLLFLLVAIGVYWYTKRLVGRLKKKCPNCGATAGIDAKNCPQCGRDLRER
jgi:ribosomal protein L40E